jgi:hypothetical protein
MARNPFHLHDMEGDAFAHLVACISAVRMTPAICMLLGQLPPISVGQGNAMRAEVSKFQRAERPET